MTVSDAKPSQSVSARLRGLDRNESCAFVTSECQTAILDPRFAVFKGLAEAAEARDMLSAIRRLARVCRESSVPVVHCSVRLLPQGKAFPSSCALHAAMRRNIYLQRNRAESGFDPRLEVHAGDYISDRMHGISSFHGTELDAILRGLRVSTLILCGVSTDIALVGTTIEAVNRGYAVVIPEDCTAGATPESHRHAVEHVLPNLATVCQEVQITNYLVAAGLASGDRPAHGA
jgi:nicotinamidase-related amidase